ncbi:putative purine permease, plant [Dioscorea sansibarensis]
MDANQLIQPLNSTSSSLQSTPATTRDVQWLFKVSVYTFLVITGLVTGTLLSRFYYDQGGNSMWLQTLTYCAGFPILYLPLLLSNQSTSMSAAKPLPFAKLAVIYAIVGIMAATDNLIVTLLTPQRQSGGKYLLGFTLILAASATYSLLLSLMEFSFDKFIKWRELSVVLKLQIYTAGASTAAATMGLFDSGGVDRLERGHGGGSRKGGCPMCDIGFHCHMQVNTVSLVALVFEVSSLFSNVINSLGTPIVRVFVVFLFPDNMNGIKVMSLFMALWGFASYFYQHYLDRKLEKEKIGMGESMVT